ncbi:hypothetical protein BDB01DRAFT_797463 [Pilobolus umbonatus]|nr:hypothetical protein BDB01DRAFT_797463 [Pilobolus umbonatus]
MPNDRLCLSPFLLATSAPSSPSGDVNELFSAGLFDFGPSACGASPALSPSLSFSPGLLEFISSLPATFSVDAGDFAPPACPSPLVDDACSAALSPSLSFSPGIVEFISSLPTTFSVSPADLFSPLLSLPTPVEISSDSTISPLLLPALQQAPPFHSLSPPLTSEDVPDEDIFMLPPSVVEDEIIPMDIYDPMDIDEYDLNLDYMDIEI